MRISGGLQFKKEVSLVDAVGVFKGDVSLEPLGCVTSLLLSDILRMLIFVDVELDLISFPPFPPFDTRSLLDLASFNTTLASFNTHSSMNLALDARPFKFLPSSYELSIFTFDLINFDRVYVLFNIYAELDLQG